MYRQKKSHQENGDNSKKHPDNKLCGEEEYI